MASEKCPGCGADIPDTSTQCEYCGTAISTKKSSLTGQDTPSEVTVGWVSTDDRLPGASSANPQRSNMVLITDGDDIIISACYDFKEENWYNDTMLVPEGVTMFVVSHWRSLPFSQDDSKWIPVTERLPKKNFLSSAKFSESVLTCIKGPDYPSSVMSGQLIFVDSSWMNVCVELKSGEDDWGPTHWMPLPDLPKS